MEITNRLTDICFLRCRPHHGQHTYNVGKFKIYLYQLQKKVEKRTPVELFQTTSQRVQMDFIFSTNVRILCLSCNIKRPKAKAKLSKKKPEATVVLIICMVLPSEKRASYLFRGEFKYMFIFSTMYVYFIYAETSCMIELLKLHTKTQNILKKTFWFNFYLMPTTLSVYITLRSK